MMVVLLSSNPTCGKRHNPSKPAISLTMMASAFLFGKEAPSSKAVTLEHVC